jgi:hypothetical protein
MVCGVDGGRVQNAAGLSLVEQPVAPMVLLTMVEDRPTVAGSGGR